MVRKSCQISILLKDNVLNLPCLFKRIYLLTVCFSLAYYVVYMRFNVTIVQNFLHDKYLVYNWTDIFVLLKMHKYVSFVSFFLFMCLFKYYYTIISDHH